MCVASRENIYIHTTPLLRSLLSSPRLCCVLCCFSFLVPFFKKTFPCSHCINSFSVIDLPSSKVSVNQNSRVDFMLKIGIFNLPVQRKKLSDLSMFSSWMPRKARLRGRSSGCFTLGLLGGQVFGSIQGFWPIRAVVSPAKYSGHGCDVFGGCNNEWWVLWAFSRQEMGMLECLQWTGWFCTTMAFPISFLTFQCFFFIYLDQKYLFLIIWIQN